MEREKLQVQLTNNGGVHEKVPAEETKVNLELCSSKHFFPKVSWFKMQVGDTVANSHYHILLTSGYCLCKQE